MVYCVIIAIIGVWNSQNVASILHAGGTRGYAQVIKPNCCNCQVINETFRLSNITPGLFREAIEDIKQSDNEKMELLWSGYLIPKGWAIVGLRIGVHLNEKYFSEALEFDPWRWQANGQEDQVSDETLLVPFGGGARLCPGAQLARLEVSLFLHHFVSKFRWLKLILSHTSPLLT
eukprot:Gb_32518 [translate_table: standard]